MTPEHYQNHCTLHSEKKPGFRFYFLAIVLITCIYPVNAAQPVPEVTSLTPDTGYAGFSYLVTLTGNNFVSNATVGLELDGSVLNITGISVLSNTSMTFRAVIPVNAKPGFYQFTLTSPSGSTRLNQAFHVQPPAAPEVINLSPVQAMAGSMVQVKITGKYFRSGGFVSLDRGTQTINLTNHSISYDYITGTFSLPVNARPGIWNCTVKNADGQSADLSGVFTVLPLPAPKILSMTPDQEEMDTLIRVAITGSDFIPGASFTLSRTDRTITGKDVIVDSPGRITGSVMVPAKYLEGLWDITVTNPDGQSVQKKNAFLSGTPSAPFSLQVTPAWGLQGTSREITIRGMGFLDGDKVSLQHAEKTLQATNLSIKSGTQITCTLDLPSDVEPGAWDVVVTSRYNKSDILRSGFTVYDKNSLILAGIEPNTGEQGQYLTTSVYGHNFINGSVVSLTADEEEPITGEIKSPSSSDELLVLFHIPEDAMPDLWGLTVTSPSGKQLTKADAFRISYNNTPEIIAIDPDRAPVGTDDLKVTVTGKNFGDGEYLDLNLSMNGTSIPVSGAVSYKGTRAIGYLTIPNGTPAGWYNLSVTRDAGQGKGSSESEMFRVF